MENDTYNPVLADNQLDPFEDGTAHANAIFTAFEAQVQRTGDGAGYTTELGKIGAAVLTSDAGHEIALSIEHPDGTALIVLLPAQRMAKFVVLLAACAAKAVDAEAVQ